MAEYIEREELINQIRLMVNRSSVGETSLNDISAKTICSLIFEAPAADVVEVKHGYWKRQKGRPEAICSECGREVVYQTIDNKWWFENYCPHCGAKMDLKEGAENAPHK